MERSIDSDKLHNALRALVINTLINSYAAERVALGFEKPGDEAPNDLYLKHLGSDINGATFKRSDNLII